MPISKIYSHNDAKSKTCCDRGCRLLIDVKQEPVIFKGEKLVRQIKICDCIIIQENTHIVMAELKSSSLNVPDIVEKLTNGGKQALKIATDMDISNPHLYFILLAKKYSNYAAAGRLCHERVNIKNKKYRIHRHVCGASFQKIFTKIASST